MKTKTISLSIIILLLTTAINAQTLISVDPSSGSQCQKLAITLTGENTNFYQATSTMWLQDGEFGNFILPSSQTVLSETQLVAEFCFSPADDATTYDAHAFNGINVDQMVLENAFELMTVENLPVLATSSPSTANLGETITLSVTGNYTHFATGGVTNNIMLYSSEGGVIYGYNINVSDNLHLEADFEISSYKPEGYYDLRVSNCLDADIVLQNAINLIDTGGSPEIVSVEPNTASQGEQLTITITGQNTEFQQGSSMLVLENNTGTIYSESHTVINDTLMYGNFNFTFNHTPGIYDVTVTNWNLGDVTLVDGFTISPSIQPVISEVTPNNASQGTAVYFTIKTENTTYNSSDNLPYVILHQEWEELYPKEINVIDSVTIEAKFIFSYSNQSGYKTITVSSPYEGSLSLENAIFVTEAEPGGSISKVVPDTAIQGESISISVSGKDIIFMQGTSSLSLSKDNFTISPTTNTIVLSDSTLSGQFSFLQTFPAGKYDVVVNGDYAWPDVVLSEGFELKLFNFLEEKSFNSFLSVYPNPCRGNLNIKRIINNAEVFTIQIYNIDGKLLFEDKLLKNQDEASFDLSFLPKGSYILNVIMNDAKQSSNLIIQ
ncbi:MAG: hypothetical protein C0595_01360 [Marinilabiliales bacterium]|nr:MAG: hypothetical protein C0595_01360 [Marinilabiliales bacterium]